MPRNDAKWKKIMIHKLRIGIRRRALNSNWMFSRCISVGSIFFFCHDVVFIGHCLNCYGLTVSTCSFTHRYVEFVECVPKWCMRSHIQRFIQPPRRNCFEPIIKFIDEDMQPNKRRRQRKKKEILGPTLNWFHIDRSFTGSVVTTQLRRRFNTFSVWILSTFKIQQKSGPQLTLWNCTQWQKFH